MLCRLGTENQNFHTSWSLEKKGTMYSATSAASSVFSPWLWYTTMNKVGYPIPKVVQGHVLGPSQGGRDIMLNCTFGITLAPPRTTSYHNSWCCRFSPYRKRLWMLHEIQNQCEQLLLGHGLSGEPRWGPPMAPSLKQRQANVDETGSVNESNNAMMESPGVANKDTAGILRRCGTASSTS